MRLDGWTLAFDLDGTLVETAPDLIGVLNLLLDEHGLPQAPLAAARHLVGSGARVMLEHGFAEAGRILTSEEADDLVERFIDLYRDRLALESRPFDGVPKALDQLSDAGARLVVCTNKRTDLSIGVLEGLGLLDRFAAVVGADLVSARKPEPAHLIESVRQAGGDPARCLMIGDSLNDLAAARGAGAPVILVSFGYTEIPARDLGADLVIDHFDQLADSLRTLLARS
ncbi:HAD family hydrolase [Brevundimonas sp. 2R-24]|uniref:Phosphoglycolate phosphatase n=1 Tax=Peiella sedimenti TaxID=3061083 RepID=A0ABT8SJ28_9CAUL|nr:HAD family hydrolase [Caulobacteraceae bacterium XZ-24]